MEHSCLQKQCTAVSASCVWYTVKNFYAKSIQYKLYTQRKETYTIHMVNAAIHYQKNSITKKKLKKDKIIDVLQVMYKLLG